MPLFYVCPARMFSLPVPVCNISRFSFADKQKTLHNLSVMKRLSYPKRDLNPHSHHWPRDFKSLVSTDSTIRASYSKNKSGKRDSNSRPQPWQGCALPTELFPQQSLFCFAVAKVMLFLKSANKLLVFLRKNVSYRNLKQENGAASYLFPASEIRLLHGCM